MHPGNHKKNEMARYLQQHLQEVGQNNEHLLEEQQNRPINGPPINAIPPMNPALVNPAAAAMNRDDNDERELVVGALFMLSGQQPVPNELHEPRNGLQNNNSAVLVGYSYDNAGNTFSALYYHPVWGYMSYANGVITHVPNDYFQQPQPVEANGNEEVGMEVDANFQQPLAFLANDGGRAELAANVNFDQQPPVEAIDNGQIERVPNAYFEQPQPVEANDNEHVGMEVDANFQQPSAFMANDEGRAELAENVNLLTLAFMEDANRQAATGEICETAQQQQIDVNSDTAPAVAVQDALLKLGNRSENGQEKGDEVEMDEGHVDDHVDEHVNEPLNGPTGDSEPDMASSSSSFGYDASDDESTQTIKTEISSNSGPDEQKYVYAASDDDSESLDSSNDDIPVSDISSVSDSMNGSVSPPVEVVDVVNHDLANVDGQNLLDSTNDNIPVEERPMVSDAMNGGVSPPLDDQAEVNDPASLADEAIQAGHAQPIQPNNQVNDGTGEENDNNVPPNGFQAGAQVDVIGRRLRDRNTLKRPAVFQAGDDDDAAPAKKGRHYVDLLLYSQDGLYMVLWSSKDWNKHPTTCPIEFVDKGREVVRFDNHSTGFNVWLDETTFKDELKSVREMAQELMNKPRCSEVEHAKRKHVCEDPLFRLHKDQRKEFESIFVRFMFRFWDDPFAPKNKPSLNQTDDDFRRIAFSAQTENWFKWHLFSFKCFLESLDANDKGDDHHYGFQDLYKICDHMGLYDRIEDFEEGVQNQRRARDLNLP